MAITNDFDLSRKKEEKKQTTGRDRLAELLATATDEPANKRSKEAVAQLQETGSTAYRGKTYTMPETQPVQTTTPSTGSGLKLPTVEDAKTAKNASLADLVTAARMAGTPQYTKQAGEAADSRMQGAISSYLKAIEAENEAKAADKAAKAEVRNAGKELDRASGKAFGDSLALGAALIARGGNPFSDNMPELQANVDQAISKSLQAQADKSAALERYNALSADYMDQEEKRKYTSLLKNPDFAANSKGDEETATRAATAMSKEMGEYYQVYHRNDRLPENLNDPAEAIRYAQLPASERPVVASDSPLRYLTDEEAGIYFYVWNTQGAKKASAYLDTISNRLNERRAAERNTELEAYAHDSPVLSSVVSVPSNAFSIAGVVDLTLQNLNRRFGGSVKPIDYNTPAQDFGKDANKIREVVAKDLEEKYPGKTLFGITNLASFAYMTGMSMADSGSQILLNTLGVPEWITLGMMAGGAAQQAIYDAKDRGATDGEALAYGYAAGINEYLFEKISLDHFVDSFIKQTGKSIGTTVANKVFGETGGWFKELLRAITRGLADAGVQGGIEASEEGFTTLANTVDDIAINKGQSELFSSIQEKINAGEDYDAAVKAGIKEWAFGLFTDVLGGLVSGGFMGSAGSVYRGVSQFGGNVVDAAKLTAAQNEERNLQLKAKQAMDEAGIPRPDLNAEAKLTAPTVESQTAAQERAADPLTFVLNKASNGETISNSDAKAILDNPQAMQALRDSGVLTDEGATASEQRAAVKEAVQALAQQESQARAEIAPRQEAAQEAAEGAQGESNLRLPTVETNAGTQSGLTLPTVGDTVNENNRQEANNGQETEAAESKLSFRDRAREAAGRQNDGGSGRRSRLGRFLDNYRGVRNAREAAAAATRGVAQQQREIARIQNQIEAGGLTENLSGQDAGLSDGTDRKTAILLNDNMLTTEQREAVRIKAAEGVTLRFMSGMLETSQRDSNGNPVYARAFVSGDGKTMYVQADHHSLSWAQLLDHEELHREFKEDPGLRKEIEDALLADKRLSPYLSQIIDRYAEAYAKLGMTKEDDVIEELLCDYRAGFDMLDPLGLKAETRTATKAAAKDIRTVEKTRAKERKKTPKTAAESVEKYSLNPETIDYAVDYTVEDEKTKTQLRLLKDITSELADIQDRINKAVGGRAAKNIHELNDYLQEHKDVWQRLWDMQNELLENGIRCDFVTEPGKPNAIDGQEVPGGLKGLPIEYVASTTGKRYKFTAFWRNMPQMFLDSMTHDSRERLRTAIVKGVEDAYARRTGETDLMPYLKDQFPTRKEIEKVAGARTLKNVRNQTQARVQSPLRDAEKTVAALNLNSACPMFTIGNNGCYLDACYLTQMANGATGTNLFRSAWYTGELLQLADSDIKLMNDLGGLRVNGVGDTTLDNKSQLKDAIRHAGMRGLKVKMITKQRSTLEVLAEMHNSGEDISHVTVQPSMDNLWIPAELDDVYGAGVRGNTQLAETVKAGRNEAAASGYDEMFGRATKIEDGILWRKYGFSPEQIREMKEDFPFVTITPRYVVCTAAEIAEIALNRDGEYVNGGKVIQTLMHGKVPAGCVSDYPGEIINFGGARHVVERKDGKWHFYGEYIGKGGAVGKVIDGPNTPYGKVQKYVEDNYTKAEQDKIWLTLKNQMCCQANDFKDACAGCQSLCARGCAAFSAEDFDYRKYTEAEKARAMAMEEPVEDAPKAAAERAGATPEQAEANAKYSQEVNALTYFSGGGLVDHALRDVIGSSMAVEFDKGAAAVYALNNGDVFVGDVRDFSKSQLDKMRGVDYFHASPVCKNYSRMNRQRTLSADNDTDITTAQATADAIRELTPKVFTLEQVPGYKGSKAYNIIADTLTELGYAWDATVAKASDYGGATSRERLMLRAVKGEALPALPQKTEGYSWFEATADLIDGLDDTTMPKFLQDRIDRTPELLDEIENGDQPILILGGTNGGLAWWAPASKPCPSITTTLTDARVLMPDGTVKKADARFFARIMGLPDSYKFTQYRGKDNQVQGMKVIGNGVPVQLTQKFFGNLLDAELGTGVKYSAETDMNDELENKLTQFAKAVDAPADFSAPDMLDSMYRLYRGELDNGRIVGPNADVNKARALAEEIDELVGRISDRREAIKNESVGDWALRMFEEQYRNPDKGLLEDLRDWGKEQRDFVDDWKGEWEPTALRHFYEAYERTDFSDINSIKRFFEDAEAAYKENGDRGVPVYGYYDETHGDNSRYSAEIDADYMAAVESGDMDTAQKMVDEAAERAGYRVEKYHGTKANFSTFNPDFARHGGSGFGYYFGDKALADEFGEGGKVLRVLINDKNIGTLKTHNITAEGFEAAIEQLGLSPDKTYQYMGSDTAEDYVKAHHDYRLATDLQYWAIDPSRFAVDPNAKELSPRRIISILKDTLALDGIERGREIVLWDNTLMKLADPVTYDDNGNVIPLSERFNSENEDIRYSREVTNEAPDRNWNIPEGYGIFIRNTGAKYVDKIFSGEKDIETRPSRTLDSYLHKWAPIINTETRQVVGEAYIDSVIEYDDVEDFRADASRHLVPERSKYDWDGKGKRYGYVITDTRKYDTPKPLPQNAKRYGRIAAEVAERDVQEMEDNPDTFIDSSIGERVKYSYDVDAERDFEPLRDEDGNIKYVYKAFYVMKDENGVGRLYPPMVSNVSDEEKKKVKGAVSGTQRNIYTPTGIVLTADVGMLGRYTKDTTDKQGKLHKAGELIRNTLGRLAVQNDKGGSGTLAFRPGWHLGEWPDAKQFNKNHPVYGQRSVMPDQLVFARCEIAGTVDYQLDAMRSGVGKSGKFIRTQAGLPRVPENGYYKYRTNPDPDTAPWYITGQMRVVEILTDEQCREICAQYGVEMSPRESGHDIDLAEYGLKPGPVEREADTDRFLKSDKSKVNESELEAALADPDYADAYKPGEIDFSDPEILKEFERNRQDAEYYRQQYEQKYGKASLEIDPDVAEQYSPEAVALREQNRQRRREGKKKVSRVRSNAFEVGGLFDEVEQQMDETKPENYTYDPISEKKSMNEARRRLRNDMAGEEAKLSQPDYDWGGSDLDTAMGILHAKRAQARLTGDYSDFIEWSHVITEKGTKGGQFVQAFAKYSRTATEQARKAAENLGKQAQLNPAQQKKADKVTKRVKKAVDNAAGDAADNALKRAQRGRSDAENLIKEIHDIFKVSKDHGTDVKEWVDLTGEELAKKISSRFATPTSKAKTTMQTILGDLVRFAQEHALPTRQKAEGGRTAIDTITDYLNNRDAYGQAWAEAQSILRAIYADDQEKLDALDSFLTATISYNGTDFDRTMFDAILESADTLGMTQDEIKKLAAVGLTDNTIDRIANGFISRVQANLVTDFDSSYEEQLRDAVRRHIIGVVAEDTPGARLLGMEKAAAKDLDIKLRELLTESKRTKADATARVARYLIDELGLTGADAAIAANTISESFMNELGRLSNEALQRLFMPGDESGMTKKQRDKLLELFRLGGFTNASVEDAVVDALGMGSVSRETQRRVMEDMARFADTLDDMADDDLEGLRRLIREQAAVRNTPLSRMSERVLNGETDAQYLKDFAMAQLASIAGDYAPRSEGERISTFQTMSHLINARTALRNLTSNQVFDLVESAANNLSLVPDMVLGAITGQRTVGLDRSWASQLKRQGALQGAGRNALEVNLDVSPEGRDKSKYGTAGRRTNSMASSNAFRRILSHLEEVMGYELNTTDEFHKGSVRGETLDSLTRMVERGDLTQEQANAFAEEEALYRSFQDDTLAGNLMGELKGLLNTIGFGNSKGRTNTKGRPIHDFGLGDLVVKYTQVPGALIHRGIEFSPLGYAKTLYDLALARDSFARTRARGEDTTAAQRRLALDIGRATTGTGLILLFAALAKMGLLRRDDDDKDKNAKAQHAAQGLSGTQLNLTALGRWLSGGDPSRKDGDVLSDIGFLEPMDSLMTIATLLAGEDEVKAATVGIKSLDGVWKAISNTSAMQTISNIISTVQYHDEENDLPLYFQIPIEIASDSVSGFIPSPVRQMAQATDTTYRDQYRSQDISDQVRAKAMNSIPGVRKLLAPKITPLGEDKKYQAPVLNALNATLNPGNINVYQANDVTDELDRLYAATEDAKIWPERNAPYSTSIDKVSYTLTPDERTQYQRTRGQLTAQMMEAVMGSAWYKQMDAGTQADVMNWIGNFANYAAKVEFADGRNIDYASDSYAKYYNAMKSGTPLADVVSQKYGKTVTFAEAGLSSQQISDLNNAGKKEEKLDYLQDAKMTDADKLKALSGVLGTDMTTSSGEPTQWAKVNTAVKDGISVDRAIEMMQDETLDYYIKWRDSDAKKAGIKSDTYLSYRADTSKMSADKDKNGKTISGSKKTKVMDYINKLSLTSKQKDTLYYDAGYAESKINEAPWHSGGGSSGGKNAPESFSRTLKLPTVEGQTAQTRSRLRLPTA